MNSKLVKPRKRGRKPKKYQEFIQNTQKHAQANKKQENNQIKNNFTKSTNSNFEERLFVLKKIRSHELERISLINYFNHENSNNHIAPIKIDYSFNRLKLGSNDIDPYALRRLFLSDLEDILELNQFELEVAWEFKEYLCASPIIAAEVLALLRVHKGEDEFYKGHEKFINNEELKIAGTKFLDLDAPEIEIFDEIFNNKTEEIKNKFSEDQTEEKLTESTDAFFEINTNINFYITSDDIDYIELSKLAEYWKKRNEVFSDTYAAAKALAKLRFENKSDIYLKSPEEYLNHPLIVELSNFIPTKDITIDRKTNPYHEDDDILYNIDTRVKESKNIYIRQGQSNFRKKLIEAYGCKCMISGCTQAELVQAAHIIQYKGEQSNTIDNGLLLRVDFHALFDNFLISVNPINFSLVVKNEIDDYYKKFNGARLIISGKFSPNKKFIEFHYRKFLLKL